MRLPAALRWALVPVAAMAGCSGTVIVADEVGDRLWRMIGPEGFPRIEAVLPTDVRTGIVYGVAAAVWVVLAARVAPRDRILVGVVAFVAGACLALVGLGSWYFPEGHPRGYQPSRIPLAFTLVGGLMAVAAVAARYRRDSLRSRSDVGPAQADTPL